MESKWDGKGKGTAFGNLIFVKLIQLFGPFAAYILLIFVALYYALFDRPGIKALKKFRKKLGLSPNNIFALHRHYFSFGVSLIDKVSFSILKKTPFTFTYINAEYISDALKKGKGVILLSAHIGNWEIAGNLLDDFFNTPINIVMLDNEHQRIKEVFQVSEKKRCFKIIPITQNGLDIVIPVKTVLNSNEIVCFHGDRVTDSGITLPFFQEPADFPSGPFYISAITGAPIIPVTTIKNRKNHYTFQAYDPIAFKDLTRENRDNHILDAMKLYISILEGIVKKHPYQWFNFFDIWINQEDNKGL
jgi:predicted LPLAT superfamily acyltransferase